MYDVIYADVTLTLSNAYSNMCMEHFVLGTAFQDLYEFYLTSGTKKLRLEFKEPHHRIDVLTNGL